MAVIDINPDPTRDRFVGVVKKTLPVLVGQASATVDVPFNGIIKQAILTIPALTTAAEAELKLLNEDSVSIYESGLRAESLSHTLTFDRGYAGTLSVVASTDVAQTGTVASVDVTIYYI